MEQEKRWEYKVHDFSSLGADADFHRNQALAYLGQDCWELVAVSPVAGSSSMRAFFKRRLP